MNGFRAALVLAALVTRRPVVWTHHEYSFCPTGLGWWRGKDRSFAIPQCWTCLRDRGFSHRAAIRRIAATVARIAMRRVVRVHTTTTQHMRARLGLRSASIIPLGVTLSTDIGDAISTPREGFTVVFAGRLIAEKGADLAIWAVAEARRQGADASLEVIGDGPERAVLERFAGRELPASSYSFLGALKPEVALNRMRLADAIIVPSVWSEPAGFVVLEAMALGVPVIATDAGGIPELAAGAALLVPRSDAHAFARAITELATRHTLGQAMIARGKSVAAMHSAGRMARQYLGLYGRVLRLLD
jgi:glycosyltransferase involved in cell wall biosynthesis